ncbi:dihydrofolate reductase [Maritimibacter sp. UBA3975]|uniref:dihydrofolate reductase n=1 Tax=Maritimibacter sp. UBA3975 TaxID=1946833 RepID=UPI000C0A979D|nr:dihydrofolate reductase [Maritimibacter sp. UBA3975]MAM60932.1 dihydrofolate reductase [Maritimibacter sp.]|tara:strand:+ start:6240 stop:6719 length:480 start_codon:yes stop_codon:yes gene_type:complete
MLTLVVARARGGAIGRDGDIPWRAPEDLKMFQRETTGGALVMGRRTWESLPVKPLKNRLNIVVSCDRSLTENVAASVGEAVSLARAAGYTRVYGIGGAGIYEALLPRADRLLVTEVELDVPDADAFFPAFDEAAWREVHAAPLRAADPACRLRDLVRCG